MDTDTGKWGLAWGGMAGPGGGVNWGKRKHIKNLDNKKKVNGNKYFFLK